jgi:hypothetical protein
MSPKGIIASPETFIVELYTPGFTVDFRAPASASDLQRLRRSFDFDAFNRTSSQEMLARIGGEALISLGVTDDVADFTSSLQSYTNIEGFDAQVSNCLERLNVDIKPSSRGHAIELLFSRSKCLTPEAHHPVRMYCHVPGEVTHLESGATHYGYVADDGCVAREASRVVPITRNTFFSICGEAQIEGDGRCILFTHFGYAGITHYGGEIEGWGRLNYIDGCTDTLLVPPLKRGDPCLNALYFPAGIQQTQHTHPSIRCGMVIGGSGLCRTPSGDYPLERGSVFFLPPETYHSFHTEKAQRSPAKSALTVIAFHPDSDFGPTDDDHPMVNRTFFKFLHRIQSAERELCPTGKRQ